MEYPFDGGQTVLRYTVVDEKMSAKENRENFPKMKELLNKVGVYFDIIDGTLVLKVFPSSSGVGQSQYEKITKRGAGRKANAIIHPGCKNTEDEPVLIHYSDIVYMRQKMHDYDIYKYIGISEATYYRKKRKMLESNYYQSLDISRLNDLEYLRNSGIPDPLF